METLSKAALFYMSTNYVLTLLAKAPAAKTTSAAPSSPQTSSATPWPHECAQSFLACAESQNLSLRADSPCPVPGSTVWMQRAYATSQSPLTAAARESLRDAAERASLDVFVEPEPLFHTPRRLFVFDMDSTLIQAEIVDELAGLAGVKDQVSAITNLAMRGEIDFPTSLTRRVSLLKGIPEDRIATLQSQIVMGEGLELLIAGLRSAGAKTAILSGGFGFFARHLQRRFGFDHIYANELEIANDSLTGALATAIVDGPRKAAALREIAAHESISLPQAVATGDGANDLPMLSLAGTGVAYHAKPIVRATAAFRLNFCGLDALLHLLNRP